MQSRNGPGSPDCEDWLYIRITEDRLDQRLADYVSESELMRRYATTRAHVQEVLRQISSESWVERRDGHGWTFGPMLTARRSYTAAYQFRALIEPQAILQGDFRIDLVQWEEARRRQQELLDGGIFTHSRDRLFAENTAFHELIAGWSGNMFFQNELVRINRERRLLEYRLSFDRHRLIRQCREHLAILDLLRRGDLGVAARFLEVHLRNALGIKQSHLGAAMRIR